MVLRRKDVNNKSRLNPQINQNLGSRIQLSELKCSSTPGLGKIPAFEPHKIPTEAMWTFEPVMTFLAPAKLINLVLSPLHLGVARKADAPQPHQAPRAGSHAGSPVLETSPLPLSSPHLPQHGKMLKKHF